MHIFVTDMTAVRPKKELGQHFLRDESIARAIVEALTWKGQVLEVGPGMGVLTRFLVADSSLQFKAVELDPESVEYLRSHFPELSGSLLQADFLQLPLEKVFKGSFAVIGNFPYNISSQIFFKILEYRDAVPEVVGMLQKEVAERLASPAGPKAYGILSVLLQMWYDIEYLFTVEPGSFLPPPKVRSAVIRLRRNQRTEAGCDEALFKKIVKATFNLRRKTIRNSLRAASLPCLDSQYLDMRPEQLSVEDFIALALLVEKQL